MAHFINLADAAVLHLHRRKLGKEVEQMDSSRCDKCDAKAFI